MSRIMRIQADGRVIDFEEKPKTQEKLNRVRTDPNWLERLGLERRRDGRYLASMGIYLFNRSTLVELLRNRATRPTSATNSCPSRSRIHRVQAYLFDGYWEDRGTIGLHSTRPTSSSTKDEPAVRLHASRTVNRSSLRPRLPAMRRGSVGATVKNSLICDG